jgi:hypothetical protein
MPRLGFVDLQAGQEPGECQQVAELGSDARGDHPTPVSPAVQDDARQQVDRGDGVVGEAGDVDDKAFCLRARRSTKPSQA